MSELDLISVYIDGFLGHGMTGLIPLNQPGITAIQGSTGSGKSTIFEVVYYLLTGNSLRTVRLVDDLANKVMEGGFDIFLNYRVDADLYKVQEIRGRKGKGLFFWKNGEPIQAASAPDLRTKILESLKMTPEDICAIAFMGQNQFHKLVYGKSGERASEIIRIYGLNQYESALQACGKAVEESNKERKTLVIIIDKDAEELKRAEEQLNGKGKIDFGEEVLANCERGIRETQQEIEKVEIDLDKRRHEEYGIREELGRISALKGKYALFQRLNSEVTSIQDDLKNLAESKYSLEKLQEGLELAKERLAKTSAAISQAKAKLKSVADLGEKCPINCQICPIGIPERYKSAQMRECNKLIGDRQGVLEQLNAKAVTIKRLLETATTRKKLQEKLKDKSNAIDALGAIGEIPDLEAKKQKAGEYSNLIGRGTAKLKDLNSTLTKFKEDKVAYIKAREYWESARKFVEEKQKDLQALQAGLVMHDLEHEYLVTALNILKKAKAYKIDYVINLLNEHTQANLDQISDGVLQARYSSQRKDSTGKKVLDSLDITVSDAYKEIPFELASGGQQTQVCLAVLSAIFETVRTITNKAISSIWLDEVFGPLSSDTLDRVFEGLIDLSKRIGVSSIKIISQRDLASWFIDHRWRVTSEEGIARVEIESAAELA